MEDQSQNLIPQSQNSMPSSDHGPRSGHELFSWIIVVVVSVIGAYFLNGYVSRLSEKGLEDPPIVNEQENKTVRSVAGFIGEDGGEINLGNIKFSVAEGLLTRDVEFELKTYNRNSLKIFGLNPFVPVYGNIEINSFGDGIEDDPVVPDFKADITLMLAKELPPGTRLEVLEFDNIANNFVVTDVHAVVDEDGVTVKFPYDYGGVLILVRTEDRGIENDPDRLKSIDPKIQGTYNLFESDTSGWQTYRNEEFGFELKYPEGWQLDSYIVITYESPEQAPRIEIEYCDDIYLSNEQRCEKGTTSDGYSYQVDWDIERIKIKRPDGGLVYLSTVERGEISKEEFNQILSTFRFIK
ncbi:MAG: hypothetical protein Q8Q06_04065 [bacterium]|nr:hypothetical protein [bacterium]